MPRRFVFLSLIVGICIACGLRAQEAGDLPVEEQTPNDTRIQEKTRRFERMQRFAESVEFQVEGQVAPAKVVNRAILRFDDNARANNDGTVWAWGRQGRPVAIAELFSYPDYETLTHTGHSLSTVSLEGRLRNTRVVRAQHPGIELRNLSTTMRPAASERARLLQIKELSRRFSAHEFWKPAKTRYELRMLPQPLYRYANADSGLVDGALFAFCHGTNPEVILLIEVQGPNARESKWQFACVRLAHAECHVTLDGADVWTCRRYEDVVPSGEPYWTFVRTFSSIDSPQPQVTNGIGRLQDLLKGLLDR